MVWFAQRVIVCRLLLNVFGSQQISGFVQVSSPKRSAMMVYISIFFSKADWKKNTAKLIYIILWEKIYFREKYIQIANDAVFWDTL